jgi:hypothetical protein
MSWEGLIEEFRALGGVAENVRLGYGSRGRGIFAADPNEPARLHAPEDLLVPLDDIVLAGGRIFVKSGSQISSKVQGFFERYEAEFGWGPGQEESRRSQQTWSEVPRDVVEVISQMGALENPGARFCAPSDESCLAAFLEARRFTYKRRQYIAPLIDLVNHCGEANGYVIQAGIGVAGRFEDEMLVCYNRADAWGHALGYGFYEPSALTHSLNVTVTVNGKQLSIARDVNAAQSLDGISFPELRVNEEGLHISHALLGNATAPDLPRGIFRSIVRGHLSDVQADQVFDSIAYFNRLKFIGVLRVLRAHTGLLVEMLYDAALAQLEGLSSCIGARAL